MKSSGKNNKPTPGIKHRIIHIPMYEYEFNVFALADENKAHDINNTGKENKMNKETKMNTSKIIKQDVKKEMMSKPKTTTVSKSAANTKLSTAKKAPAKMVPANTKTTSKKEVTKTVAAKKTVKTAVKSTKKM